MNITISVPGGHQTAEITAGPGGGGSVIAVDSGQQQATQGPGMPPGAPGRRRDRDGGRLMMPARKDTREAGRPAVAVSTLATPPGRPGTSRPPYVIAGAAADPREHDWAGPGFTKPGPEPDTGQQAGYAPMRVEAAKGMTTAFEGPATSITDGYVNGHRQMSEHLAREANGREAEADV